MFLIGQSQTVLSQPRRVGSSKQQTIQQRQRNNVLGKYFQNALLKNTAKFCNERRETIIKVNWQRYGQAGTQEYPLVLIRERERERERERKNFHID